jgi:hypothetical protein
MKALILFLLFCLTLEYDRLSQYDSKVIYGSGNFYLSLSGFKSGDKVYIEVSYDSFFMKLIQFIVDNQIIILIVNFHIHLLF